MPLYQPYKLRVRQAVSGTMTIKELAPFAMLQS